MEGQADHVTVHPPPRMRSTLGSLTGRTTNTIVTSRGWVAALASGTFLCVLPLLLVLRESVN